MTLSINQMRADAATISSNLGMSGGEADAFRHTYFSAIITAKYFADVARVAGDTVEWLRAFDGENPERDRNMDLHNNDVGRRIGEAMRDRPIQDLIDEVARAVWDGRTVTDFGNDWRTLPENFPVDLLPTRGLPGTWDAEGWNENGIDPDRVHSPWQSATAPRRPRDPLAIDLDGDGIETVGITTASAPILFDHDADGVKTGSGWLLGDDAWLVLDRDGNGSIDSGRELFGVDTLITTTQLDTQGNAQTVTRNATSGFEALQSLDTGNGSAGSSGFGDRIFNVNDAGFDQVRVWRDLNQDGVSQAGELQSLAATGIASISLTPTAANTNLGNGNTVTGTAVVTRSNGSTTHIDGVQVSANNLELADNPFYRDFAFSVPPTEAARALREMAGSTLLREVASRSRRRLVGFHFGNRRLPDYDVIRMQLTVTYRGPKRHQVLLSGDETQRGKTSRSRVRTLDSRKCVGSVVYPSGLCVDLSKSACERTGIDAHALTRLRASRIKTFGRFVAEGSSDPFPRSSIGDLIAQ